MNAFAKYLGLTGGHFNDILKKRRGLSGAKATVVADKLGLHPFEREFFLHSVRSEHSRSKKEQAESKKALKELKTQEIKVMKLDLFTMVSQWHHFAILELARIDSIPLDKKWIAQRLGLELDVVTAAIDRLVALGLLKEEKGRWVPHKGLLKTSDDIPSPAIKAHHNQVLSLAKRALYEQDVQSREFSTIMMAIDIDKLETAKKKMREFQVEMSKLLTESTKTRNALYCFSMQLFSLMKK